jgi:hypothetical protein
MRGEKKEKKRKKGGKESEKEEAKNNEGEKKEEKKKEGKEQEKMRERRKSENSGSWPVVGSGRNWKTISFVNSSSGWQLLHALKEQSLALSI